jgi:hypothetical protein
MSAPVVEFTDEESKTLKELLVKLWAILEDRSQIWMTSASSRAVRIGSMAFKYLMLAKIAETKEKQPFIAYWMHHKKILNVQNLKYCFTPRPKHPEPDIKQKLNETKALMRQICDVMSKTLKV